MACGPVSSCPNRPPTSDAMSLFLVTEPKPPIRCPRALNEAAAAPSKAPALSASGGGHRGSRRACRRRPAVGEPVEDRGEVHGPESREPRPADTERTPGTRTPLGCVVEQGRLHLSRRRIVKGGRLIGSLDDGDGTRGDGTRIAGRGPEGGGGERPETGVTATQPTRPSLASQVVDPWDDEPILTAELIEARCLLAEHGAGKPLFRSNAVVS
jgi:hypothetical protein